MVTEENRFIIACCFILESIWFHLFDSYNFRNISKEISDAELKVAGKRIKELVPRKNKALEKNYIDRHWENVLEDIIQTIKSKIQYIQDDESEHSEKVKQHYLKLFEYALENALELRTRLGNISQNDSC